MDINWIGANAANFRAGRPAGFQPTAVVIHIMDGTLTGTDAWFNDAHAKVSAHYGVGAGGEVHQYVQESDTAFHAGVVVAPTWRLIRPNTNPNFYTIGVEHEGVTAQPYPWPALQLAASLQLVREIAGRWDIPLDLDHVVPHHAIRASKTCPGEHFDIADYVNQLGGAAAQPAPPAQVTAVTALRRRSSPTTQATIVGALSNGDTFAVAALVRDGEAVAGNPLWYRGADGAFVWAGGTDHPAGV